MCGIARAYTRFTPASAQPLVERLHHRGPDGDGLTNVLAGSLGHTRLAIVDVDGGHQPMAYGHHILDVQSVALALRMSPIWKVHTAERPPKALLRQAFAAHLPAAIINRPKQKFSQGAGSAELLAQRAEDAISDEAFVAEQQRLQSDWNYQIPNKEALYYYRLLREFYRDEWILPGMGQSRSL